MAILTKRIIRTTHLFRIILHEIRKNGPGVFADENLRQMGTIRGSHKAEDFKLCLDHFAASQCHQ